MLSSAETDVLRSLAVRVAEHAETGRMLDLAERWRKHNGLQTGIPMVLCNPEGAWAEVLPETELCCSDPLARSWEYGLRMKLHWVEELRDDTVLTHRFVVPWVWRDDGFGIQVAFRYGADRGSYTWDPPFDGPEGVTDRLHFRQPFVDRQESHTRLGLAQDAFGDILDVQLGGSFWWTMGLTWTAIDLIGLEGLMLAMVDQPAELHRLMAWLRDEQMHFIEWFQSEGVLTANTGEDSVASGGLGFTDEIPKPAPGTPAQLRHLWGFAESQETVGISPEMFAEFVLPYQLPLLEKFGMNAYGCCEPVHLRWKHIQNVPRLRRVSVSPWCDQASMAAEMGRQAIFSRKPNPSLVCVGFEEEAIRKDLKETLSIAKDCVLEIILKDTHTVQHDRRRLKRWVQMAREEIERTKG